MRKDMETVTMRNGEVLTVSHKVTAMVDMIILLNSFFDISVDTLMAHFDNTKKCEVSLNNMNNVYEPIDLCAVYDFDVGTPDFDVCELPEPDYPFHDTIERKIGNVCYVIRTECGGSEALSLKIERLISTDEGEKDDDKPEKLC